MNLSEIQAFTDFSILSVSALYWQQSDVQFAWLYFVWTQNKADKEKQIKTYILSHNMNMNPFYVTTSLYSADRVSLCGKKKKELDQMLIKPHGEWPHCVLHIDKEYL